MSKVRNILFPVDFTRCSAQAATQVREMAMKLGARVTLLNTIEVPKGWYTSAEVEAFSAMVNMDAVRHEREEKLVNFSLQHFRGIEVESMLEQGDPAAVILDTAAGRDVDLIMMPTQGCGMIRRTMLGSVTAKVLHDATCPVWTATHVEEAPHIASAAAKILCAVDLGPGSVALLRRACTLASQLGAQLEVLHVVPTSSVPSDPSCAAQLRPMLLNVANERMKKLLEEAGITVPYHLEEGKPAPGIRSCVNRLHGTLVVIGRGHGGMRTKVFGIIGECPSPVYSFPG